MNIDYSIYPYRLSLKKKEPIELKIDISNPSDKEKMISLEILTPRTLSIDKSGYKSSIIERFQTFEPKKKITKYFDIYPKVMTRAGEDFVLIRILEHYNDFNSVQKTIEKKIPILIGD